MWAAIKKGSSSVLKAIGLVTVADSVTKIDDNAGKYITYGLVGLIAIIILGRR